MIFYATKVTAILLSVLLALPTHGFGGTNPSAAANKEATITWDSIKPLPQNKEVNTLWEDHKRNIEHALYWKVVKTKRDMVAAAYRELDEKNEEFLSGKKVYENLSPKQLATLQTLSYKAYQMTVAMLQSVKDKYEYGSNPVDAKKLFERDLNSQSGETYVDSLIERYSKPIELELAQKRSALVQKDSRFAKITNTYERTVEIEQVKNVIAAAKADFEKRKDANKKRI